MNEPHDELERRLKPPVEPLAPPLGSFERISRAARRRRFLRAAASSGSAAAVVVAVAGALVVLPGRGDRPPNTVTSGSDRTSSYSVQSGSGSIPPPRVTADPSVSGRAAESGPHSPAPGAFPEPGGGVAARCGTSDLDARLERNGAATGHFYATLVLTNTGTRPCYLAGYPGVSVLDGNRAQIGEPAKREAATATLRVTLRSGESASATIETGTGTGTGECRPEASFLRVYPPGSYEALVIPTQLQVCDHIFTVTTLASGTEGNHP